MSDNTELKSAIEYILNQGALDREFIENADLLDAAWAVYDALGPTDILALIADLDEARNGMKYSCAIRLKKQIEQFETELDRLRAEVSGLRTGYEAYEQVNAELKAEVKKVDSDRKACWAEFKVQGRYIEQLKDENEALREEIEHSKTKPLYSTRANSRRYIWLRDNHIGDDPESINLDPGPRPGLNSAIDAAMGKGEQS